MMLLRRKLEKPMEVCLHDSGNVYSINSLNTIIANAMESSKLGEASFDEHDIFSPPNFQEKNYFDDSLPLVYDDYNDSGILIPPTIMDKVYFHYDVPPIYDIYNDKLAIFSPSTIEYKADYTMPAIYDEYNDGCEVLLSLLLIKLIMLMWRVMILLCMWIMIRMLYVIAILLSLFMMPLKIILREENMGIEIFMLLNFFSL